MIDRLLASAAYGERWGRHWLDQARYADTSGDGTKPALQAAHGRKAGRDRVYAASYWGNHRCGSEGTLSMHSGTMAEALPGIGAWVSYGLGTEKPNLPSHVVFAEALPYAGAQSWDSNFLNAPLPG